MGGGIPCTVLFTNLAKLNFFFPFVGLISFLVLLLVVKTIYFVFEFQIFILL